MTRAVAFVAAALLAATLGAAQDASTGTAAGSQSSGDVNGQSKTITGCLSSSSLGDNHFKLTDDKGQVYSLTGLTDQLTSHAGQEVRITGLDQSRSGSSSSNGNESPSAGSAAHDGSGTGGNSGTSASSGTSDRKTLQVTAVQKISDHCSSEGAGKPRGAGTQGEARASAQVKLISTRIIKATDDDGTLAGSVDGGQSSNQAEPSAQTGTPDQAGANDLPRTATALPLLGILGLGSLVAGFIVRR